MWYGPTRFTYVRQTGAICVSLSTRIDVSRNDWDDRESPGESHSTRANRLSSRSSKVSTLVSTTLKAQQNSKSQRPSSDAALHPERHLVADAVRVLLLATARLQLVAARVSLSAKARTHPSLFDTIHVHTSLARDARKECACRRDPRPFVFHLSRSSVFLWTNSRVCVCDCARGIGHGPRASIVTALSRSGARNSRSGVSLQRRAITRLRVPAIGSTVRTHAIFWVQDRYI